MPRRVAIVGGGVAGLGAAWALHQHPDRFEFRVFEANDRLGGNAVTVDMPQADGSLIPFDISVTACIPSVYHHIQLLLRRFQIDLLDTKFNYSVRYRGDVYAHDFDSEIRTELQDEIARFQRLLQLLHLFGALTRSRSKLLNALNPFNYISMGTLLNLGGFSGGFRYKILKPMFVNFLMATNVFDMPAALFSRYLEFFNIESATPMQTWDQGTRRIYDCLSADFADRIDLNRAVRKVYRRKAGVVIEDEAGVQETYDDVILRLQRESDPDDAGPAELLGALSVVVSSLRERVTQPRDRALGRVCPAGQRGEASGDAQQSHRAVRRPARQL